MAGQSQRKVGGGTGQSHIHHHKAVGAVLALTEEKEPGLTLNSCLTLQITLVWD